MSKLFYKIYLEEEYDNENDTGYDYKTKNLPHFKQLKEWLPKEWKKCKIENTFDGILKDKVASCTMTCREDKEGIAYAWITIEFVPDFRLSQKRREACWEQLDAQMCDGFGESYDGQQIPGAPQGWLLRI